jgi:hypothetical protein
MILRVLGIVLVLIIQVGPLSARADDWEFHGEQYYYSADGDLWQLLWGLDVPWHEVEWGSISVSISSHRCGGDGDGYFLSVWGPGFYEEVPAYALEYFTDCWSQRAEWQGGIEVVEPASADAFMVSWSLSAGDSPGEWCDCWDDSSVWYNLYLSRRHAWHVATDGSDLSGTGSAARPFATLQHALATAAAGDQILIAAGLYGGADNYNLDPEGKDLTIVGQGGAAGTIIDCSGPPETTRRGFIFQGGESASLVIDGLSIINGWAEEGGALQIGNGSSPTIRNCRLSSNAATMGGAIHCSGGAAPRFMYNLIAGNEADLGGAAYMDSATPQFLNCTIVENQSPPACLFASASTLVLENTIVAFNGPGASIRSFESTASLECCDIYRNDGGDYVYAFEGAIGTNGNISVSPLFCSSEPGDYTLVPSSICLPSNDYNPCGELIGAYGEGAGCDLVATEELPKAVLALQPNYPNPFNPTTEISFVLPEATAVELAIFDLAGRRVRSFAAGVQYAAGSHSLRWDGRDDEGQSMPSGAYLCRLQAGAQIETRKLMLLK